METIVAAPAQLREARVIYEQRIANEVAGLAGRISSHPMPAMPFWVSAEVWWRLHQAAAGLRDLDGRLRSDAAALERTARLFEEADRQMRTDPAHAALQAALAALDQAEHLGKLVLEEPLSAAAPGGQLGDFWRTITSFLAGVQPATGAENKHHPQTVASGRANAITPPSQPGPDLAAKANEVLTKVNGQFALKSQFAGKTGSEVIAALGRDPEKAWDGKPSNQCKAFVNDMLNIVGAKQESSYYPEATMGKPLVDSDTKSWQTLDLSAVMPGDVIQIYDPKNWDGLTGFKDGMHSAIVVGGWNAKAGGFTVLDSNFSNDLDGKVRVHNYNPWTANPKTRQNGLKVAIWRPH